MKINKITKIGFIVTTVLVLFIWGLNYLKGRNLFDKGNRYFAVYDHVNGLTKSSPVLINGFQVGHVDNVYFKPDNSGKLVIEMLIGKKYQIPENSVAEIFSIDLMGSKGLKIVRGSFTGKYQKVGDTLLSAIEGDLKDQVSLQILPLKKKAESLISSFDSVLVTMNAILNENTRRNLMRSFESLKNTIVNLERTTFTLDTLMSTQKSKLALIFSNVESITYNLKNNNELIANVIKNFSNISDSLAKANVAGVVTKATSAIEQIDKIVNKINAGEGSLGMLLNNDTLYKNLQNSTYNLNRLLRDVRENPKRYLHFSALDLGRTVYILDPEDAAKYSEKKKKKKDKQEKLDKKLDE